MRVRTGIGLLGLGLLISGSAVCADKFPIGTPLEGPKSRYTQALIELAAQPALPGAPAGDPGNPVALRRIDTPGEALYIGLEQAMIVNAPIEKVAEIVDDVAHYRELLPDYKKIEVREADGNKKRIFWEERVPIFFVPNVKYETNMISVWDERGRRVYREQLLKSDDLIFSDSLTVLERDPADRAHRTLYREYDFFDAHWGIAKTLAPGKIWNDSAESIYLSDVAFKLKAENPSWEFSKIAQKAEEALKMNPLDAAKLSRGSPPN